MTSEDYSQYVSRLDSDLDEEPYLAFADLFSHLRISLHKNDKTDHEYWPFKAVFLEVAIDDVVRSEGLVVMAIVRRRPDGGLIAEITNVYT